MNDALRNQDREHVEPWRDFIWLFLHALRKLPPCDTTMVYRGCKKSPEDMDMDLTDGSEFQWSAFSSTATTANVMQTFLGGEGPRTMFHLEITEKMAVRDVQAFSLFPQENEVLLPPQCVLQGRILVECWARAHDCAMQADRNMRHDSPLHGTHPSPSKPTGFNAPANCSSATPKYISL